MDTTIERTTEQTTVWLDSPWSLSLGIKQCFDSVAFGAPEDASVAGRAAVDDYGDDLETLADS